MINSKELRDGNFIHPNEDKGSIAPIWIPGIYAIQQGRIKAWPVDITQDILVKCGLNVVKMVSHPFILLGQISIEWDQHTKELWLGTNHWEYGWEPELHVKYLHQLQNIYFSLTGEELNNAL
jgi:hypothetical protein